MLGIVATAVYCQDIPNLAAPSSRSPDNSTISAQFPDRTLPSRAYTPPDDPME